MNLPHPLAAFQKVLFDLARSLRPLAAFAALALALPHGFSQDPEAAPAEAETEAVEPAAAAPAEEFYPRRQAAPQSENKLFEGVYKDDGPSAISMGVSMFGYLLVLGGFGVAAWYLFRRGFFRKSLGAKESKLKILESRMLGSRQFLMVVEYEDSKVLLGVGPGKIDYLTTLNTYSTAVDESESPKAKPAFKIEHA